VQEWDNPMYQFRDTIKSSDYDSWIPTSAMIYDSVMFEKILPGYQTLYVEGREMLSLDIESEKKNVGVHISSQRLPERILTVFYKLTEVNSVEFQRSFKKLMGLLYRQKDVEIHFNDELDTSYFGRYSATDKVPGNTNSISSSFTITCSDPRKYTKVFETNGEIFEYLPHEVTPDSISFAATKDSSVRITNGRQTISISNSAIKKGDKVELLITEGKVLVNGENKTRILDLTSRFKGFKVKTGDVIKSDNGNPLVRFRGAWL